MKQAKMLTSQQGRRAATKTPPRANPVSEETRRNYRSTSKRSTRRSGRR